MKIKTMLAVVGLISAMAIPVWAEQSPNLAITADTLSYDGTTGKASATGNIVITKDDKVMTGATGWYNTKTEEAYLGGGVSMMGTNMSLSASTLHSYNNSEIEADGSVHLTKDNKQVFGNKVTYNTKTEYATVVGDAKLVMDDDVLTANEIQGNIGGIDVTATGNVTLNSAKRNLSATADSAQYTQTPGQNNGVAYLRGNAHAVQNGNVLNAPELRINLADNSAQTEGGRSTLIITPQQ